MPLRVLWVWWLLWVACRGSPQMKQAKELVSGKTVNAAGAPLRMAAGKSYTT